MVYFGGLRRFAFGFAIFISAFLLFQVQLLLGKFLLPWFGGTSRIWATCLLFFQILLLAGYYYAHRISCSFGPSNQGKVHLAFLGLAAVWILLAWWFWGSPLLPGTSWKPAPSAAPIAGILKLLVVSVGVPFLLLSATGPLLQNWYAHLDLGHQKKAPYFLYALSNAGSLLGLLSYPIFFEPQFRLRTQRWLWGSGFALFLVSCALCAWQALSSRTHTVQKAQAAPAVESVGTPSPRWLWFALPMLGSIMLLATTNFLTQDVAPIPLLWVLPLCIYLLSFVLTFHGTWYRRGLVSSAVCPHPSICSPRLISRRRYETDIADCSLSPVSLRRLHGLPRRSSTAEARRALPHFLLSAFVCRWRVRRDLCRHYRAAILVRL